METLYPTCPRSSWFFPEPQAGGGAALWTREENKEFERALAIHDKNTADRWYKIAAMIPGKTVSDVRNQYIELVVDVRNIEAGLVPVPGYLGSSFTLDLMDDSRFDGVRKRPVSQIGSASEHERKKGVPWTEDEHRRFLMGLVRHGKGDWRNISRNYVMTKTATQVASHAQKYFLRLNAGVKDKRRPSIHDITTGSLAEPAATACNNVKSAILLDQSVANPRDELEEKNHANIEAPILEDAAEAVWNGEVSESVVFMLDLAQSRRRDKNLLIPVVSSAYDDSYEKELRNSLQVQGQNLYQGSTQVGQYTPLIRVQSRQRILG